jgi:ribosomal protein L22
MIRAIRRFVASLNGKSKILFFVLIIFACIIALMVGIYTQFYYKYSATDPLMIGINVGSEKTAEEIASLQASFNSLFNNTITIKGTPTDVDKLEDTKNYVYSAYKFDNQDENYYSVMAEIPIININSEKAEEINQEIRGTFYEKANEVMRQKNEYINYNVTYEAYINQDILSLVIKSSLKQGKQPEKVMIKTYNYSIPSKNVVTLLDLITLKKTTSEKVQSTINKEIKQADTKAKIIAAEFGNVYERNLSDNMYKVQNVSNFFLTDDGYVYIVFAYGNSNYTNEMDIVIF